MVYDFFTLKGTSHPMECNLPHLTLKAPLQWVFDDPRVGLVQEPFVSGADDWIDRVVDDIPNAKKGFNSDLFQHTFSRSQNSARLAAGRS